MDFPSNPEVFPNSGPTAASQTTNPQFDLFEWYPQYQSCQRYFLDHAQHSELVRAVAAFINIALPCQSSPTPVMYYVSHNSSQRLGPSMSTPTPFVSLIPFLRRLVATGMDFPGVLHGYEAATSSLRPFKALIPARFFGDDWAKGVGPLHEQERRNYLFAAKSGGWASVKKDYDMSSHETVPFLRPLQGPVDAEIEAAEKTWSEWLAMEDWMVGSRAPNEMQDPSSDGR
ncbi:MAG: hypothetical protein M1824_001733 [Vezdaea acicularis]|nr:MAG: hypothetical protein M1824_001733 [Vezdaea acicularis]